MTKEDKGCYQTISPLSFISCSMKSLHYFCREVLGADCDEKKAIVMESSTSSYLVALFNVI